MATNQNIALTVAKNAAQKAAQIIESAFENNLQESILKKTSIRDIVTQTDLASEKIIIQTIKKSFPNHQILSEEQHQNTTTLSLNFPTWVIDPLDGTTNFAQRIPFFSISIAFVEENEIKAAVVYNPITKEFFEATKDTQSKLNNNPISVSNNQIISESIITQNLDYDNEKRKHNLKNIQNIFFKISGFRMFHSTALELCYVAAKKTDAAIISGANIWDVAAAALIANNAGAKITDFENNKWIISMPAKLICSNNKIHCELLSTLNSDNN